MDPGAVVSRGGLGAGEFAACAAPGESPFPGTGLGMAQVILTVAAVAVAAAAAHTPVADIPHFAEIGFHDCALRVGGVHIVHAQVAPLPALGIDSAVTGKGFPVGLLLNQNQLFHFFQLFRGGYIDEHPFAVVIGSCLIVIIEEPGGKPVPLFFEDFPLLLS